MNTAPKNPYGIVAYDGASDMVGTSLYDSLKHHNLSYTEMSISNIVGSAGCASLVFYTSPKTNKAIAVLVVPTRDIDSWGEEYYYIEDMTPERANRVNWCEVMDCARKFWKLSR